MMRYLLGSRVVPEARAEERSRQNEQVHSTHSFGNQQDYNITDVNEKSADMAPGEILAEAQRAFGDKLVLAFSGAEDVFLHAELTCGDETRSDVFFPNFWKKLPWADPKLEIVDVQCLEEGVVDVEIKAESFARCVHLEGINEGCADGVAVTVGDAYFDLRAGETRTIRLTSAAPIQASGLTLAHWLTEWK